jgi:hypothetical protein
VFALKQLVPGIEKHPDLRRQFTAAYLAESRKCKAGCGKTAVVLKYKTLVAFRENQG